MRIISRLDIKGDNLIKSIQFEGLRALGCPIEKACHYYKAGVDEIICIDTVASLYGRNHAVSLVEQISKNVFLPISICGGIRSLDDAREIILRGADKIGINTAAIENPGLISQLAEEFGSQAVILSVEAKKRARNSWEAYTHNGREKTGLEVKDWVQEGVKRGAGSILLTSIDKDGTLNGFDIDLCNTISKVCMVPLVLSGGMGNIDDLIDLASQYPISGIAIGSALHYSKITLGEVRNSLIDSGIQVRH